MNSSDKEPGNARVAIALTLSVAVFGLLLGPLAADGFILSALWNDSPWLIGGIGFAGALALVVGFRWVRRPQSTWQLLIPAGVFGLFVAIQIPLGGIGVVSALSPEDAFAVRMYDLRIMAAVGGFGSLWASMLFAIAAIQLAAGSARKGSSKRFGLVFPAALVLTAPLPSAFLPTVDATTPLSFSMTVLIPVLGLAIVGFGMGVDDQAEQSVHARRYAWLAAVTALSAVSLIVYAYCTSMLEAATAIAGGDLGPPVLAELWNAGAREARSTLLPYALSALIVGLWATVLVFAVKRPDVTKQPLMALAVGVIVSGG